MPLILHRNHDIFWLKISIQYVVCVQELQALQHLGRVELRVLLHHRVAYLAQQSAPLDVLQFKIQVIDALKLTLDSDHAWKLELLQIMHDSQLCQNMVAVLHALNRVLRNHFQGREFVSLEVECQDYFAEAANADRLLDSEIIQTRFLVA